MYKLDHLLVLTTMITIVFFSPQCSSSVQFYCNVQCLWSL